MYVVATAGHVDHGKSTLVRALTGMEPDRWAEERRRGMTIDLGFAWTAMAGETVAFVDVPGHERFVPNMLAGIGPVPAALLVVAADEGWMPQTQEHVAALDALQVRHAVLAVTRSDLADPAPATAEAVDRLARTSIEDVEAVAVALPPDGPPIGLDAVRAALLRMLGRLPAPDPTGAVRLWIDRSFTVRGSGTVVTGTLSAGSLRPEDGLLVSSSGREVRVRGLQSLGRRVDVATATARVAVNLRGVDKEQVSRGDALLTPGSWSLTSAVDVRINGVAASDLPAELVLHLGSAAVPVHVRPLGPDTARLVLGRPLPLRAGDLALLRDPGRHCVVSGAHVLDADPPPLRRRGAAVSRAEDLRGMSGSVDGAAQLRRYGIVRLADLQAMGAEPPGPPLVGDWLVDPDLAETLRARLLTLVAEHAHRHALEPGPTVDSVRQALDLPDRVLVGALAAAPLAVRDARVVDTRRAGALPAPVATAVAAVSERLRADPFVAPEARDLLALGLGPRELAAAERAGALVRIADGVVLLPGAPEAAARALALLPQPFTVSEARQALGTSRRVAVPLLEHLDRRGLTRRSADGHRTAAPPAPPEASPEPPAR